MALSLLDRIKEGIGAISDYAKASQTEARTRELQRELEKRRAIKQPETPITTGNIFEDISQQVRTALRGVKTIQPRQPEPARFEPKITDTEEAVKKAEIAESPIGLALGTIQEIPRTIGGIGQEIARNIASAGITLAKPLKGKEQVSAQDFPELLRPLAEKVLRDEPIKSIEQRIAEAEIETKRIGQEIQRGETVVFGKKVSPQVGRFLEQNAPILAFGGVMGSVGLDLTPFGGLQKNAFRAMIKAKTIEEAITIFTRMGVADDLARQFAPDVVKVADEKTAATLFNRVAELQKTTRVARPIVEIAPRVIPPVKRLPTPKAPRAIEGVDPFADLRKERGFITSAREAVPELRIAGQYIPRSTDNLAIRARNLIKDDIATAEKLVRTGTDDKAVATASELIKHYENLANKATTKAAKNAFYDKAAEVAVEIAPKLTEQGRAIQAASILGKQTPEGQLRFAARTIQKYNEEVEAVRGGILGLQKKVPELTAEQAESILTQAKKIQNMSDGADKAMAFKKLQDEIADLVPSPWWKKLINLWKAGLLTGLKTSGLNTFSNLFHGISEVVKDIPAVAVDNVVSLFTGKRNIALTLRGFKGGIVEGFGKGLRYMKTGFDERNVGIKLDWKRVNFGKGKVARGLQKYEETIFHWMGAQDQPFYYGSKARSLASQAIAQGKNSKLKGEELRKFVQNLIESPTDEMLRYAVNDAEMAVFQNRTLLGDVARGIQRIPGGELVVPFGRTPSAVAMQIINYSPLGIVKTIVENVGKGRFDQRLFAQGLGRGITGTGVMFIGMSMFKNDMVSLDRPTTEREKNQWELEGRKPNSFKTPDGKWRSVLVLGPPGMLLILGGQLQSSLDKNGSLSASLLEAGPATAKSFTEQTFLVGVNQFASALNDPGRYAQNVAARTIGSVIPTIVGDVARATDPLERRTFAKTEGFFAPAIGRVPGARQMLEPQIDVFGSPLARAGNALETMIDPTRPTRIKSSEVVEELKRLFNVGFPATPTRFADEKSYTDVLTPEQITYLQEKAGLMLEEKLKNLFASPQYKKLDNDAKAKKVQDFTNKARVNARAEMVEELVRQEGGTFSREKMSELKKSGFLTQQVFNKWEELFEE